MRVVLGAALALVSASAAAAMTVCAADPGACGARMCRFAVGPHGHPRYDFRPCPTNPPHWMVSVPAAMSAAEQAAFCGRYPAACLPGPQPDGRTTLAPRWVVQPYQGHAPGGFVPP